MYPTADGDAAHGDTQVEIPAVDSQPRCGSSFVDFPVSNVDNPALLIDKEELHVSGTPKIPAVAVVLALGLASCDKVAQGEGRQSTAPAPQQAAGGKPPTRPHPNKSTTEPPRPGP